MSGSRLRKEVGVCIAKWVGLSILVALLVNFDRKSHGRRSQIGEMKKSRTSAFINDSAICFPAPLESAGT